MPAIAAIRTPERGRSDARLRPLEDVHVLAVDLDSERPDLRMLSEDERGRASGFRFERDRHRFVAARCVLRRRLAQYLDTSPRELRFEYGPQGKPSVRGCDLSFNASHSGRAGLFAFASGFDLGVDVELLAHARSDDDRVAERFFSRREVRTLQACAPAVRAHAFLRCWTRKEAFIKGRGEGLTLPLQDFDVEFAAGEPPALLRTAWSPTEPAEWTLCDLSEPASGAVAALAARAPEIRVIRCAENI
jgi:4'-phosphopantetheinyl transferase